MKSNSNLNDAGKSVVALFAVFLAIVWRDSAMGTLSLNWTVLMGAMMISLSGCILFSSKTIDQSTQ